MIAEILKKHESNLEASKEAQEILEKRYTPYFESEHYPVNDEGRYLTFRLSLGQGSESGGLILDIFRSGRLAASFDIDSARVLYDFLEELFKDEPEEKRAERRSRKGKAKYG